MPMPEVRKERTGWRDQGLSERHRKWGYDCPLIDLDFVMLEYDRGRATALVEYKNEHAKTQHSSHPSYRALIGLGNDANLPVFACRYADDFSWWRVVPLNMHAKKYVSEPRTMTEWEWVTVLCNTRGWTPTDEQRLAFENDEEW